MYSKKNYSTVPHTIGGLMEEIFHNGWNNVLAADSPKDRMNVPVNILETEKAYELSVIAPGLSKEDFKINVERDVLQVSFDQKEEANETEGKWLRKEYKFRSFKRSFTLNEKIDANGISAKYTDGVLKVTLPKKENTEPTTQQITVA